MTGAVADVHRVEQRDKFRPFLFGIGQRIQKIFVDPGNSV